MRTVAVWVVLVPAWLASVGLGCQADDDGGDPQAGGSGGSVAPAGGAGGTAVGAIEGGGSMAPAGTTGGGGSSGAAAAGSGGTSAGGSGGAAVGGAGGSGTAGSAAGTGGAGGTGAADAGTAGSGGSDEPGEELEPFSFFVTSLEGMVRLAKNDKGFGGDLRHGEADGLSGADKICTELAESSMPGSSAKEWHAFLSVNEGPGGGPVHAIDRIGDGPWYDRLGRLVAMTKEDLLQTRPRGADLAIINDLPNELGIPNHKPDPSQPPVDNHHVLTGSGADGHVYSATGTCDDWTSTAQSAGRPRVGFSWPAGSRQHWISGQDEGGCGAGAVLEDMGGSNPNNPIVGSGGGYGAIYCFALMP